MKNQRINEEQLLEQLETILKDELVATIKREEQQLKISFVNGQQFSLSIIENK